jgi:hypothetical protein
MEVTNNERTDVVEYYDNNYFGTSYNVEFDINEIY